jgi:hypothetical protein
VGVAGRRAARAAVLARNTIEHSKNKSLPQKEHAFEPDLLYPMLRGKETHRWSAKPSLALLFPHVGDRAIAPDVMEVDYNKTWQYLKAMKPHLEKRKMYDLSRKQLAFYSLFESGPFLHAPYKVVWKEIASGLQCAVVSNCELPGLGKKVIIPDHKLVIVPFKRKEPANYLCAALNSTVARFLASTYIVSTQIGSHVLEFVRVPEFDDANEVHTRLAELSAECHKLTAKNDVAGVTECESEIDARAAELWGVSRKELKVIQGHMSAFEGGAEDAEDGE